MTDQPCGCPDFTLSRRRFLATTAAGAGALTAGQLFGDAFRQVAYGAAPGGNVVVVLSLRGTTIDSPSAPTTTCSPRPVPGSWCPRGH